jgi:serine phosphatase RsbU (regulator of sigma subunit)
MVDDNGRPRYGRAYADQLKQDLADEMNRRRAENEQRMRRLRDQFKDQNKQIEEASSGASPPGTQFRAPGLRFAALIVGAGCLHGRPQA